MCGFLSGETEDVYPKLYLQCDSCSVIYMAILAILAIMLSVVYTALLGKMQPKAMLVVPCVPTGHITILVGCLKKQKIS